MRFLFRTPYHPYESAMIASENDSGALVLMLEKLFVRNNFRAPFIEMTAFEHYFAQKVSCHPVDPVKLTFIPTKRTSVWILLKPMGLAIAA